VIARVASLHRHPVKSMLGEALESVAVDVRGLRGDRARAVIERDTGTVASAKQPRKWGWLLQCRAVLRDDGVTSITLPGGETALSSDADVDDVLSDFAERPVTLSGAPPERPRLERHWPEVDGLAPPEVIKRAGTVTALAAAAPGTFFDYAPISIVTTSTLRALRAVVPSLDFAAERFRPNIVLDSDDEGFIENEWAGRRLVIGDVHLDVLTMTPRCAVPSLAHGELPAGLDILRTVVKANRQPLGVGRFACVGVYANVVRGGSIRTGDVVTGVPAP
jgi:uncharacterized protein